MNILIPMAGSGQRFVDAGYAVPKPFIDVLGKPMIERVVTSLGGPSAGRYIFVVRDYNAKHCLRSIVPDCLVVVTGALTAGAACTALMAAHFIDNDEPLLIANSDQIVQFYDKPGHVKWRDPDGIIYTFYAHHPKWSYAAVDNNGWVWGVAEKQVISRRATAGVYWFRRGSQFVHYAKQMIAANIRVNNEFYIAPVFNQLIADGYNVSACDTQQMWGLGTPEDLRAYEDAHRS